MKRTGKRTRRICAAAVLTVLLLPLCTCRKSSRPPKITLVLKTTVETAEFWEQVMNGVNTAAEEFGVDLTVTGSSAETEIDEQIEVVRQAIEDHPDVMILVASDYNRMADITNQAVDAGIQVVTMDSDVNTDRRVCYVASRNYKIGQSLGELLPEFLPEGGKVAILAQSDISTSGIDRAQGAKDAIAQEDGYSLLGVYNCNNNMDEARSITKRLLREHPDIAAFLCTNEVGNLSVAGCLADEGLAGDVIVIGCDNSQRQIQYLEQNVIQGIVIQRPFNMGYTAVKQAVKVARGESVPSFVEIGCVTITRSNMYNSDNQKLLFPFSSSN